MMPSQSILIYRSPAEAYLWESGLVFPLIVAMVLGGICAWIAASIWERVCLRGGKYRQMHRYSGHVAIATALVIIPTVVMVMM